MSLNRRKKSKQVLKPKKNKEIKPKYCLICGKRLRNPTNAQKYCKGHSDKEKEKFLADKNYRKSKAIMDSKNDKLRYKTESSFNTPTYTIVKLNSTKSIVRLKLGSDNGKICLYKYADYVRYNLLHRYYKDKIIRLNHLDRTYSKDEIQHKNRFRNNPYLNDIEIEDNKLFIINGEIMLINQVLEFYQSNNTNFSLMPP